MKKKKEYFSIHTINHDKIQFTVITGWRIQLVEGFYNKGIKNSPIILVEYIARASIYKIAKAIYDYESYKIDPYLFDNISLRLNEDELNNFAKLFLENDEYFVDDEINSSQLSESPIEILYTLWKNHYDRIRNSVTGIFPKMDSVIPQISFESYQKLMDSPKNIIKAIDDEYSKVDSKDKDFDFSDKCNCCGKISLFSFYVIYNTQSKRSLTYCSIHCLHGDKSEISKYPSNLLLYNIRRCTAYYKCKEIGNLRVMCERKEFLSKKNYLSLLTNFCEPAQAGQILSTYKIEKTLNTFGQSSDKQFKTTLRLTWLIIFLTIINIVPAVLNFFDIDAKRIRQYLFNNNQNIDLKDNSKIIQPTKQGKYVDINDLKRNNFEIKKNSGK